MSEASMPAVAIARKAATVAMLAVVSSGPAMRRSLMPVLLTIHSSSVSTIRARSALVRTLPGAYAPQPVTWTPVVGRNGITARPR